MSDTTKFMQYVSSLLHINHTGSAKKSSIQVLYQWYLYL